MPDRQRSGQRKHFRNPFYSIPVFSYQFIWFLLKRHNQYQPHAPLIIVPALRICKSHCWNMWQTSMTTEFQLKLLQKRQNIHSQKFQISSTFLISHLLWRGLCFFSTRPLSFTISRCLGLSFHSPLKGLISKEILQTLTQSHLFREREILSSCSGQQLQNKSWQNTLLFCCRISFNLSFLVSSRENSTIGLWRMTQKHRSYSKIKQGQETWKCLLHNVIRQTSGSKVRIKFTLNTPILISTLMYLIVKMYLVWAEDVRVVV